MLVFSTYPVRAPRGGGAKRARAIVEAYGGRFSDVAHLAVFDPRAHAAAAPTDVAVPQQVIDGFARYPHSDDVAIGHAIVDEPVVRDSVAAFLRDFQPDVIHLEQPFGWIGLGPLLRQLGQAPRIVFGSANVEAPLREAVLRDSRVSESEIARIVGEIRDLERELSRSCDLLAACTPADLEAHRAMGAERTVLAPNGMAPLRPTVESTAAWRSRLSGTGAKRTALFVGGAHQPNWIGLNELIGTGLGFMGADERLVVAGGIGEHLRNWFKARPMEIETATFPLRGIGLGELDEVDLQGLIAAVDVILLPISVGGGSNLKTAEAILADKPVVATSVALRGFEWFADFPNVRVADSRHDFQQAMVAAFRAEPVPRTAAQRAQAQTVTWEQCLAALVEAVASL